MANVVNMTRAEWEDVLAGLRKLPAYPACPPRDKAIAFVEGVIAGTPDIMPKMDKDGFHYAVACSRCKNRIHAADDFTSFTLEGQLVHYDCNMREDLHIERSRKKDGGAP